MEDAKEPGAIYHQGGGQRPSGEDPPPGPVVTAKGADVDSDDCGSGTAATVEAVKTRQSAVARRVRREVNMVLDGGCRYVLCELLWARGCYSECGDSLQGKISRSTRAKDTTTYL